jgi:SAM-dependent methyltransferase
MQSSLQNAKSPYITDVWNSPTAPYEEQFRIIDFRPSEDYQRCHIQSSFHLPLTQFGLRKDFPWFILPEKSIPFSIIIPSKSEHDGTAKDLERTLFAQSYDEKFEFPVNRQAQTLKIMLIIRHLIQSDWQLTNVFIACDAFWKSIPSHHLVTTPLAAVVPCSGSIIRPETILPFIPSEAVVSSMPYILSDPQFPKHSATVMDLGCGAGRDLAWILHHYPGQFGQAIALDAWKGSCDRTFQLFHLLNMLSKLQILRVELKEHGVEKIMNWSPLPSYPMAWTNDMGSLRPCDLVILNRFLPPRSYVMKLHEHLRTPGSYALISTFVKPHAMSLESWIASYATPKTHANLLLPNELTQPLNPSLLQLNDSQIQDRIEEWGWGFHSSNGYEIMINKQITLPDGRPILWFLVKKKIKQSFQGPNQLDHV